MIKTALYCKVKDYDFESLFKKKGYTFFTKGKYNLNIIGVRASGAQITNSFDDVIVVIYRTPTGAWTRAIFQVTTDPGLYYCLNPIARKGTAILCPGQYKGAYGLGKHRGKYLALCQIKPLKVYRDSNKDEVYDYDPNNLEEGMFGINIHKAGTFSKRIDTWSAGCQVFASNTEFNNFMTLCKKQVASGCGDTFTYTLIKEEDL
jgi:hypothetical protein